MSCLLCNTMELNGTLFMVLTVLKNPVVQDGSEPLGLEVEISETNITKVGLMKPKLC